ncbi:MULTISPECIES: hypothetical protein [Vibrio]|uniref:hypothetical protein n=1 Tax=Vibrio TaxID=662 RepID=UPI000769E55F|nr:hypothetical protein [Vibrio jasicida]
MAFDDYWKKVREKHLKSTNLEGLIVKRIRANTGSKRLPYRMKCGALCEIKYNESCATEKE